MTGFFVHRDSRLEMLAGQLADALDADPVDNVLATRTLVVAHPGLGRWLLRGFAQRGKRGIAANFDMVEPWQWLESAAEHALPDPVGADWKRERLRWHVHALLPEIRDAQVAGYLSGEHGALRRMQLAERLADVYAQYLIYRPDWIADWERGEDRDNWQADLWRRRLTPLAALSARRAFPAPSAYFPSDAPPKSVPAFEVYPVGGLPH